MKHILTSAFITIGLLTAGSCYAQCLIPVSAAIASDASTTQKFEAGNGTFLLNFSAAGKDWPGGDHLF